jgi:hypothetical protein
MQDDPALTRLLNFVLCEFATQSLASETITISDLQGAKLVEGYAGTAGGGRPYPHTTRASLTICEATSNRSRCGTHHLDVPNEFRGCLAMVKIAARKR